MKLDQRIAVGLLGGMAVVSAWLGCAEPAALSWLPQCPIHQWTGLWCPGCGTTRMLFLLAHGHPLLAFQENALAMALLPVVVYALVRQVRGAGWVSVSTRSAWALTAVVLVFGVARNIPVAPFSELAPRAF